MDLFFGNVNEAGKILLEEDEFRHLKVLRSNVGDTIQITDGKGNLYTAGIEEINKHNCVASILKTVQHSVSVPTLHLAIAPTKNMDRMEWLVEKCVELGIFRFTFLQCRHSERKEIKTDRLKRIAISAIKQSGKTFLPEIGEMMPFSQFMKTDLESQRLICAMEAGKENHIKQLLKSGKNTLILIGPEGDFNADEISLAAENGFMMTGLGPERLRTETAALAACVYFNFTNHG